MIHRSSSSDIWFVFYWLDPCWSPVQCPLTPPTIPLHRQQLAVRFSVRVHSPCQHLDVHPQRSLFHLTWRNRWLFIQVPSYVFYSWSLQYSEQTMNRYVSPSCVLIGSTLFLSSVSQSFAIFPDVNLEESTETRSKSTNYGHLWIFSAFALHLRSGSREWEPSFTYVGRIYFRTSGGIHFTRANIEVSASVIE